MKRRAVQQGLDDEEDEEEVHIRALLAAPPLSPPPFGGSFGGAFRDDLDISGISVPEARGRSGLARTASGPSIWSGVPTPARTPQGSPARRPFAFEAVGRPVMKGRDGLKGAAAARQLHSGVLSASVPQLPSAKQRPGVRGAVEKPTGQQPAAEFVAVVLRAAQLRAEANRRGEEASAELAEAENEVEMLAFLLEEADALAAEQLLADEVFQQPHDVAALLKEQLDELASRGRRS